MNYCDSTQIMPLMQPLTGGRSGVLHSAEARVEDYNAAVIIQAKAMAVAIIDLLADDASGAKEIIASFQPHFVLIASLHKTRDTPKLNGYFEY